MKKLLKKLQKIDLLVILAVFLVFVCVVVIPSPRKDLKKTSPMPIKFIARKQANIPIIEVVPTKEMSALVYRLEIFFDPEILESTEISAGTFFNNPQILHKEINNQEGKISLSVGVSPEEIKKSGEPQNSNSLAIFTFKAKPLYNNHNQNKGATETTILFGKNTIVIGKEGLSFQNLKQTLKSITIRPNASYK